MRRRTVLSNDGNCIIELGYDDFDPSTWIVRRWRRRLWFRKRLSSDWFNDRDQALAFAKAMMQEDDVRKQA